MILILVFSNLIIAILRRLAILLIGRVEKGSTSPHRHVCSCCHYHLQQILQNFAKGNMKDEANDGNLGKLIIAIGNSKVQWSQPVVFLALLINFC